MMQMKAQRGMTIWTLAVTVLVAVIFLFVFFKLLPAYITDFNVSNAFRGMVQEARSHSMSNGQLEDSLSKRFDVNDVNSVRASQDLVITDTGSARRVTFNYQVTVPMAFNISVLLDFRHSAEIPESE